jgi:hypothetical protein
MDLSEFPPPPVPAGFSLQSPPPMPLSVEHLLDSPQYTEHAHLPIDSSSREGLDLTSCGVASRIG